MKGGLHWAVCEAPGETFLSLIYSWDLLGLSLSLRRGTLVTGSGRAPEPYVRVLSSWFPPAVLWPR